MSKRVTAELPISFLAWKAAMEADGWEFVATAGGSYFGYALRRRS